MVLKVVMLHWLGSSVCSVVEYTVGVLGLAFYG